MDTSIFKPYDIRGLYPTQIYLDVVKKIAGACINLFNPGEIVVAYDARHGSPELAIVLKQSLMEEAKKQNKAFIVRAIGLSTTPMFYFLVNHFKASGGCMITASHNPKEYNGVKIVKKNAEMISGLDILKAIQTQ